MGKESENVILTRIETPKPWAQGMLLEDPVPSAVEGCKAEFKRSTAPRR